MEQDEHGQGKGSSPDPSLLHLYPHPHKPGGAASLRTAFLGQHPCDSSNLLGISVPGTESQRTSPVPPAQAGEPRSGFPELKGRSFPSGTAPGSSALHPCGEMEVRDGTAGTTRLTHPQNSHPPCQGHSEWAGSAGSTGGSPGISLVLANRSSGSQQHPLPWCGMGTGLGSSRPHTSVISLCLSVRHGLDLAISVCGFRQRKNPG